MSILEIAKIAGVSHTTVARVINETGNVSEEKIRLVRQAIEKAGYVPKPPEKRRGPRRAGSSSFKSGNVAFITSAEGFHILGNSPVMMNVIRGIEESLASHGISMIQGVVNVNRNLPPIVARGDVDGVIIWPSLEGVSNETIRILSRYQRVYVMTGREQHLPGDRVLNDNEQIGILAAKYLLSRGHKVIAQIDYDDILRQKSAWVDRWYGFEETALESGVQVQRIMVPLSKEENLSLQLANEQLMCEFLKEKLEQIKPTGVFCTSDSTTAVLYPILKRIGYNIGSDIEIISCNNEQSILAGLDPVPPSIDIRPEFIGQKAVEQLRWRIKNPKEDCRIFIEITPKLKIMGKKLSF